MYAMQHPPALYAELNPHQMCTVTRTTNTNVTETEEFAKSNSAIQESSDASEVEAASLLSSLSSTHS